MEENVMKTSFWKKLLCAAMGTAMLMGMAGCAGEESKSDSKTESAASAGDDQSLQKVKDAGKLVLGLDPTFKPMGYTDENDQLVGFDIDVAKEVCERMGVELVLTPVNWETKEQDLNVGTIDCIWNGLSVSEERKKVMLMSDPYMNNEMIFVVNEDSDVHSLEDLHGLDIAVQNGSTAQTLLQESDLEENGAVITALETNIAALQELELGMVDAVFMDSVVANYEITTSGKAYRVMEEGLQSEEYAIGFRLGDQALCDEVTKYLLEMVEDGTMAEISTTWFGSDVTTIGK